MRSKKDLQLIETHLRMPWLYFKSVDKVYPKSLAKVPFELSKLILKINDILWGSMDRNKINTHYRYFGIPPQYIETSDFTAKKEVKDTVDAICNNIDKFLSSGVILYVHSPYETSAIAVGASICKAGAVKNRWLMMPYPEYVDNTKDFKNADTVKLKAAENVDLLCLYLVGKEYTTEFTLAGLKSLLMTRKVAGKVTILTSHLTAEEFADRYGSSLCICALECTDAGEMNNFKALRRLVEG